MNIEVRDNLRNSVLEKLQAAFPNAQRVKGGIAFVSDTIDEETGVAIPVTIDVTVKQTADGARSKAYDINAAVEAFKNAPGRRVVDPAKKAHLEELKAATAARKAENMEILTSWVKSNLPTDGGMIPSEIYNSIPELAGRCTVMQIGSYMKELVEQGLVVATKDEKKHNVYSLAQ